MSVPITLPNALYSSTDAVTTVRGQIADNLESIARFLEDDGATEEAIRVLREQAKEIRP